MQRRIRRGAALVAAATLLPACFSYRAAEVGAVPAGQEVRVVLASGADVELPNGRSAGGAVLRGRLIERRDDGLTLRIAAGERRPGYIEPEYGREVRIRSDAIATIERRELDVQGTALLVGGVAGVAAALLAVITQEAGEPGPNPGPDPVVVRIPLLSLPVR